MVAERNRSQPDSEITQLAKKEKKKFRKEKTKN